MDAAGRALLARRRTWVTGGVLLVLSAVVAVVARGPLAGISPAKDWLFAGAAILLVIGVGRVGSVTGRRPVGTVATILLVSAPATQSYWYSFVPDDSANPNTVEDISALISMAYYGIVLALAIISVVQIARARVVPSPWRWAPLWVLVWTLITVGIGLNLFGSAPLGSGVAIIGSILVSFGPATGVAFLGILGIALGARPAPESLANGRWQRGAGDPLRVPDDSGRLPSS